MSRPKSCRENENVLGVTSWQCKDNRCCCRFDAADLDDCFALDDFSDDRARFFEAPFPELAPAGAVLEGLTASIAIAGVFSGEVRLVSAWSAVDVLGLVLDA